jgi:uncharacterized protein Usg
MRLSAKLLVLRIFLKTGARIPDGANAKTAGLTNTHKRSIPRFDPGTTGDSMSLRRQMQDYRLTTAEILYHLPDQPNLLQSYVWQDLDLAPRFPILHRFLGFWTRELDGKLHSVRVGSAELITPGQWQHRDVVRELN